MMATMQEELQHLQVDHADLRNQVLALKEAFHENAAQMDRLLTGNMVQAKSTAPGSVVSMKTSKENLAAHTQTVGKSVGPLSSVGSAPSTSASVKTLPVNDELGAQHPILKVNLLLSEKQVRRLAAIEQGDPIRGKQTSSTATDDRSVALNIASSTQTTIQISSKSEGKTDLYRVTITGVFDPKCTGQSVARAVKKVLQASLEQGDFVEKSGVMLTEAGLMTTAESKAILTNKAHQIADGESFLNVLPVPHWSGHSDHNDRDTENQAVLLKGSVEGIKILLDEWFQEHNQLHRMRNSTMEEDDEKVDLQVEEAEVKNKMANFGLDSNVYIDRETHDVNNAMSAWRGQFRGALLVVAESSALRMTSFVGIIFNLWLMWAEVDSAPGSSFLHLAEQMQFVISTFFCLEGLLNLVAIPNVTKHLSIFVDAITVISIWVVEITLRVVGSSSRGSLMFLLLIRNVRFYRVAWKLRNMKGARTLRVLLSGIGHAAASMFWTMLGLAIILFCASVGIRSLLANNKSYSAETLHIADQYFSSVPATMLTLVECYMHAFPYNNIVRTLLADSQARALGAALLVLLLLLNITVANIIAAVFIEQLIKQGRKSDDSSQKEQLSTADLNYANISRVYKIMDKRGDGKVSKTDFEEAVHTSKVTADLVHGGDHTHQVDSETIFHRLDATGRGTLSFSDFAFGVVSQRCGSRTVEKLVTEHQQENLIKQNAMTYKHMKDTAKTAKLAAQHIKQIDDFIRNNKDRNMAELQNIRNRINNVNQKINLISNGLEASPGSAEPHGGGNKSLINVKNVREAKDIGETLLVLKKSVERAADVICQQASDSEGNMQTMLARFNEATDKEVESKLKLLREESLKSAKAASKAAQTAAKAAASIASCSGDANTP